MSAGEGEIATAWHPTATSDRHRLRLQFDWQQDRHQLQLWRDVEAAGEVASELLLISEEGTPNNRWPPSPPLQSLAIEERGEQTVALAVGMAGGAHWSASIETLPEPLALRFDYACRLNEEPAFLGSTFRIAETIPEQAVSAMDFVGGKQELAAGSLRITSDPPIASNSVLVARWQFTLRYVATNA